MRTVAIAILAAVSIACTQPSAAQTGPAEVAVTTSDDVVITGEWPGPRLWRIRDADTTIYVLGTVSPLQKGLKWKSRDLAAALPSISRGLSGTPNIKISLVDVATMAFTRRDAVRNPDDGRLSALLDPATKAQYESLRASLDIKPKEIENWRPYIAGGILLDKAISKVGLTSRVNIDDQALDILRKKGVKVRSISQLAGKPLIKTLNDMKPGTDVPCFKAQLASAQNSVGLMRQRADAWAKGQAEKLRALPPPGDANACLAALQAGGVPAETLQEKILVDWVGAIKTELAKPGGVLAVGPIEAFDAPGGVFDRLRALGIVVEAP